MASWIPFLDQLSVLNWIGDWLTSLPDVLIGLVISLVLLIFYPLIVFLNLMYADLNIVYMPFAALINAIIGFPGFFYQLDAIAIAPFIPTPWHSMMLISVGVAIGIKIYMVGKELLRFIPFVNMG